MLRLCAVLLALSTPSVSSAQSTRGKTEKPPGVDAALYQALEWRNIGPFRGGRVTAVAGVPSKPWTFFFGSTGGGVWTTEDAGLTWRNVLVIQSSDRIPRLDGPAVLALLRYLLL